MAKLKFLFYVSILRAGIYLPCSSMSWPGRRLLPSLLLTSIPTLSAALPWKRTASLCIWLSRDASSHWMMLWGKELLLSPGSSSARISSQQSYVWEWATTFNPIRMHSQTLAQSYDITLHVPERLLSGAALAWAIEMAPAALHFLRPHFQAANTSS